MTIATWLIAWVAVSVALAPLIGRWLRHLSDSGQGKKPRQERDLLESAFCELHRKAQTLAYEVIIRPQEGEDWEPVRRAADELATVLCENMPIEGLPAQTERAA